jgi:hypothetical protein
MRPLMKVHCKMSRLQRTIANDGPLDVALRVVCVC